MSLVRNVTCKTSRKRFKVDLIFHVLLYPFTVEIQGKSFTISQCRQLRTLKNVFGLWSSKSRRPSVSGTTGNKLKINEILMPMDIDVSLILTVSMFKSITYLLKFALMCYIHMCPGKIDDPLLSLYTISYN